MSSLPGPYGVGDLGPAATVWIDTLAKAKQTWWQTLPLGRPAEGDSPYFCHSAFAGNPLLISPELLFEEGLLTREDLRVPKLPEGPADFKRAAELREPWLHAAFHRGSARGSARLGQEYAQFAHEQADWLDDYALFEALLDLFGGKCWLDWPTELRQRKPQALKTARRELASSIARCRFMQFLFFRQLEQMRQHARSKGVRLLGDLPIFVSMNSSDVWSNQHLFQLNRDGRPKAVSGVPPDAFSATGQLWDNPLYDWRAMERDGYRWWISRLEMMQKQFDAVRIDHFRGLAAYWAIPAGAKDARRGRWVKGPGRKLFDAAISKLGPLSVVAEDLGMITPDVDQLRKDLKMPGMAVLQFAFDSGPASRYLPHNFSHDLICYPGTHDNSTCKQWFEGLKTKQRRTIAQYFPQVNQSPAWAMIEAAWASVACGAITQLQDLLELGKDARMNSPGQVSGNWRWRYQPKASDAQRFARLGELTHRYARHSRTTI